MANYATADLNIFQTTAVDYVDDSKYYKSQLDFFSSSLGHSVNASNPIISVVNVNAVSYTHLTLPTNLCV